MDVDAQQPGDVCATGSHRQSIGCMIGRRGTMPTASGLWEQTAMNQRTIIDAVGAVVVVVLIIVFATN